MQQSLRRIEKRVAGGEGELSVEVEVYRYFEVNHLWNTGLMRWMLLSASCSTISLSMMDEDCNTVEYQEFLVKVKEGVRNMPAPCNQVLWSYYWDGFSHKQIAELYGMKSEDVCKTQASRCKKKFSEFIKRIRPNYGK